LKTLLILIFISPNISRKKWGKGKNENVSVIEKEEKEKIAL
jgi:hypothetical protein